MSGAQSSTLYYVRREELDAVDGRLIRRRNLTLPPAGTVVDGNYCYYWPPMRAAQEDEGSSSWLSTRALALGGNVAPHRARVSSRDGGGGGFGLADRRPINTFLRVILGRSGTPRGHSTCRQHGRYYFYYLFSK